MSAAATEPTTVTVDELRTGLTDLLAQVKETGTPLNVDGGIVLLPAAEYARLRDRDYRLESFEELGQGLREADAGLCRPAGEVFARIEAKLATKVAPR